jgi:trigger factor
VVAVRTKELPEADDEFAQSVNIDCETMEDLRRAVRSSLDERALRRAEEGLKSEVMEALTNRNRFEVPEYLVAQQAESRMRSLARIISANRVDPRNLNVDWEQLRAAQWDRAEREVRGVFILEKITELEGIEPSDEEVANEIERMAEGAGQTVEALKARLTKENALDSIKLQVRNRKALEFVTSTADISIEEVEAEVEALEKGEGDIGGVEGGNIGGGVGND